MVDRAPMGPTSQNQPNSFAKCSRAVASDHCNLHVSTDLLSPRGHPTTTCTLVCRPTFCHHNLTLMFRPPPSTTTVTYYYMHTRTSPQSFTMITLVDRPTFFFHYFDNYTPMGQANLFTIWLHSHRSIDLLLQLGRLMFYY